MEEERPLTKRERRALAREEKKKDQQKSEKTKKLKNWIIGLLVIVGLAAGGVKLWGWINTPTEDTSSYLQVGEDDWLKGEREARATLIEYSDFQCPACATYYPILKQLESDYADDLLFVYRHYPLVSIHKNAIPAAKASEAAGMQGKFWEMHDILFEKQADWENEGNTKDKFVSYAKDLGLDEEKFASDYESVEIEKLVNDDLFSGNRLSVNSTPTFFLNGERISNPRGYDEFKSTIENRFPK